MKHKEQKWGMGGDGTDTGRHSDHTRATSHFATLWHLRVCSLIESKPDLSPFLNNFFFEFLNNHLSRHIKSQSCESSSSLLNRDRWSGAWPENFCSNLWNGRCSDNTFCFRHWTQWSRRFDKYTGTPHFGPDSKSTSILRN